MGYHYQFLDQCLDYICPWECGMPGYNPAWPCSQINKKWWAGYHNSQNLETTQVPKDRWVDKLWYIYMIECSVAIREKWSHKICFSMNRHGEYHTEWSELEGIGTNTEWSHFHTYLQDSQPDFNLLYCMWATKLSRCGTWAQSLEQFWMWPQTPPKKCK